MFVCGPTQEGQGNGIEGGCLVAAVGSKLWGGRRACLGCAGSETVLGTPVQLAGVCSETCDEARRVALLDRPQHCQALSVRQTCIPQACYHLQT